MNYERAWNDCRNEISELCTALAAEKKLVEALKQERDEAKKNYHRCWREMMAVKDAVTTPDKLFASQLECAAADAVRELSAKLTAAEQENAALTAEVERLREGIASLETWHHRL